MTIRNIIPTATTFGDFIDALPPCREQLVLHFTPSSAPPRKRWRNNGISADFLADYLVTCLPIKDEDLAAQKKQAEIKDAVSFIANELLENAMKFSYKNQVDYTQIRLCFDVDKIIFFIKNSINPHSVLSFQRYIEEVVNSDPEELYIRQLERNAENHIDSGLGLLTMLNDYSAKLGWKFEYESTSQDSITVTTMVQLAI